MIASKNLQQPDDLQKDIEQLISKYSTATIAVSNAVQEDNKKHIACNNPCSGKCKYTYMNDIKV